MMKSVVIRKIRESNSRNVTTSNGKIFAIRRDVVHSGQNDHRCTVGTAGGGIMVNEAEGKQLHPLSPLRGSNPGQWTINHLR